MPRSPLVLALLILPSACAPDDNLLDERARVADADAGAQSNRAKSLRLAWPADRQGDIPRNLAAVIVMAPAALALPDRPFRLRGPSDAEIPLGDVSVMPCPGADICYRVPVLAVMPAPALYTLTLTTSVLVDAGESFAAGTLGSFSVAASLDHQQPRLDGASVAMGAGCLNAAFVSDKPVAARLRVLADGQEAIVPAGVGATSFDFAARVPGLAPGAEATAIVEAVDVAGNLAQSSPFALRLPSADPAVAITEVLANPAGSEITQEFVELRNYGAASVSLDGWALEDAGGADRLTGVLSAGATALVVASSYNPGDGHDPPPRAGTLLIRVSGRIGRDGLGNSGEAVHLKTPAGALVSSYGGWVNVNAAAWNGRSVHRVPRDDACDHPSAWTQLPSAPTPGW